jgi:hypothetical protein
VTSLTESDIVLPVEFSSFLVRDLDYAHDAKSRCKVATGVVLLRETHRIRVVRLGVVAHPESTRLELRFGLCFGETVVITAVCHVVAGFQGLRAPAS